MSVSRKNPAAAVARRIRKERSIALAAENLKRKHMDEGRTALEERSSNLAKLNAWVSLKA